MPIPDLPANVNEWISFSRLSGSYGTTPNPDYIGCTGGREWPSQSPQHMTNISPCGRSHDTDKPTWRDFFPPPSSSWVEHTQSGVNDCRVWSLRGFPYNDEVRCSLINAYQLEKGFNKAAWTADCLRGRSANGVYKWSLNSMFWAAPMFRQKSNFWLSIMCCSLL